MITTRPLPWSATATRVPALLNEKWRGIMPPAAKVWRCVKTPVSLSMEKVTSGSEESSVLLVVSKLGIVRVPSPRDEIVRNLESG